MFKLVTVTIAALTQTTSAWWDKSHLIVARRAYDIIEAEDPAAMTKANSILAILKNDGYSSSIPALDDENKHPFVESAPFADNIKGEGYSYQSDWHFVNDPYLDQDQNIDDYDFTDYNAQNVSEAIVDLWHWLRHDSGYQSTTTYVDTMKYFSSESDGESFALRLLIHYVGDSHQPCHSITRVDDEFPEGDRGCNDVWIPNKDGAGNLHAVWDSLMYEYAGWETLPLSDAAWTQYGEWATSISDAHPVSVSNYHDFDPFYWAQENEGYAQAVYGGVVFDEALSAGYVNNSIQVAEKRVSYAGRRLANMVMNIYGDYDNQTLFLQ